MPDPSVDPVLTEATVKVPPSVSVSSSKTSPSCSPSISIKLYGVVKVYSSIVSLLSISWTNILVPPAPNLIPNGIVPFKSIFPSRVTDPGVTSNALSNENWYILSLLWQPTKNLFPSALNVKLLGPLTTAAKEYPVS